jgi:hypothetical protein
MIKIETPAICHMKSAIPGEAALHESVLIVVSWAITIFRFERIAAVRVGAIDLDYITDNLDGWVGGWQFDSFRGVGWWKFDSCGWACHGTEITALT